LINFTVILLAVRHTDTQTNIIDYITNSNHIWWR